MNELLERFLRYVKIETTADEDSATYPSTDRQKDLSRLLAQELGEMGLKDAEMDEYGLVWATVPGNVPDAPTIGWIAHVDTSPEFTGKNVNPVVHENYDGKDIVLPKVPERVIKVSEFEDLGACKGKTIITTDGSTLLGADDKAGVSVIMQTVKHLLNNPDIKHGPIRICFSCDEEIGHGADHIDLDKMGAVVAYTLDGEGQGHIEAETFSADLATVVIEGNNIHPGYGKGKMENAVRIAGEFLEAMPFDGMAPETTEGREGFMHPYVIEGGVPETKIKVLLRDFDTPKLRDKQKMLEDIAAKLDAKYAKAKVRVEVQTQYRNMAEGLKEEPRAVEKAAAAMKAVGIEPEMSIIRGGTDGSRLTEMGLPTPNLSTGMHNFHSPLEWACLEEMETAMKVLIELAQAWSTEKK